MNMITHVAELPVIAHVDVPGELDDAHLLREIRIRDLTLVIRRTTVADMEDALTMTHHGAIAIDLRDCTGAVLADYEILPSVAALNALVLQMIAAYDATRWADSHAFLKWLC